MAGGSSLYRHHCHHEPKHCVLINGGVGAGLKEGLRLPLELASLEHFEDIWVHEVHCVLDDLHVQHAWLVLGLAELISKSVG